MTNDALYLDDLNQIIKMFSYAIQERIDELGVLQIVPQSKTKGDNEAFLLTRYLNYQVKSDKEIQCVNKFSQRIMQVFCYFKSRSNHKVFLTLLEQKLVSSIDSIVTKIPIHLGQLLKLIVTFVKTPFQPHHKNTCIGLSMSSVKIKINNVEKLRSKPSTSTNPFNPISSCIESRCFTSSCQPVVPVEMQRVESRQLRTSISGVHIRRHTSEANKSSVSKKYRFHEDDLKCYNDILDLDKKFVFHLNQAVTTCTKQGPQRLQKQFLKRNQCVRAGIEAYTRRFDERTTVDPRRVLTEATGRRSNLPQKDSGKNYKYSRLIKPEVTDYSKREPTKRNRAHTSLRQDAQQTLPSNLFRQRRMRKLFQQNINPKSSLANNSEVMRLGNQSRILKII